MGELSHTPLKSYFMAEKRFLVRFMWTITHNFANYSYLIIWTSIVIQYNTVQFKTVLDRKSKNGWKVLFASKMFARPLPFLWFITRFSFQRPAVISKHVDGALPLETVFNGSYFLVKSFTLFVTHLAQIFRKEIQMWVQEVDFYRHIAVHFLIKYSNSCTTLTWSGLLLFPWNFWHNDMKFSYARLSTAFILLANSSFRMNVWVHTRKWTAIMQIYPKIPKILTFTQLHQFLSNLSQKELIRRGIKSTFKILCWKKPPKSNNMVKISSKSKKKLKNRKYFQLQSRHSLFQRNFNNRIKISEAMSDCSHETTQKRFVDHKIRFSGCMGNFSHTIFLSFTRPTTCARSP